MNKTIRLFLFVVLTLIGLQSLVFAQDNRPLMEVVQLNLKDDGELYVTYHKLKEVKEEALDSNGKPVMLVTMTNKGPVSTPKYLKKEIQASVTMWKASTKGALTFLDLDGKHLDNKTTLQKFTKETAVIYLHTSYENVKDLLTIFNKDTILLMDGPNVVRGD